MGPIEREDRDRDMSVLRAAGISALAFIAGLLSCGPIGSQGAAVGNGSNEAPGSSAGGSTSGGASSSAGASTAAMTVPAPGSDVDAAGSAASGENSTTDCVVPALPVSSSLPAIATLPDPFLSLDGTRITTKDQWTCRRAEIMAQAQLYELGTKPPKPSMVSGSFALGAPDAGPDDATDADPDDTTSTELDGTTDAEPDGTTNGEPGGGTITVNVGVGANTTSFTATVQYPPIGSPPYPAMIGIDGIELGPQDLLNLGVALIIFPASLVAQQNDGSSRGQGLFYDLYGSNASAGAMMAWAWGVSRLIDVIQQTPSTQIDPTRLGVTGCSRDGKGALIAGAFDERISLTIPQESGSGGAAGWRTSDYQYANGTVVQTLMEIVTENVWFESAFSAFSGHTDNLPFDHHTIEGLVAPRALLIIENTSQVWLGNYSTFNNSMAANLIWQGLGIGDHMGVSQNGDHAHCVWDGSQQPEVTAYVQKFLVGGGTGDTNVLKTDAATYCPESGTCTAYGFDESKWVDWTVPTLQ